MKFRFFHDTSLGLPSLCNGLDLIQPSFELRPGFFLLFFSFFGGIEPSVSSYQFDVLPTASYELCGQKQVTVNQPKLNAFVVKSVSFALKLQGEHLVLLSASATAIFLRW
jgi:hypothetical protein